MHKISTKYKLIFSVFVLMLALVVSGCNGSNDNNDSSENDNGAISREEFVGLLVEEFGGGLYPDTDPIFSDVETNSIYFDDIQTCAQRGILVGEGTFNPSDSTTLGFAVESSLRAIGVRKLTNSDTGFDENQMMNYYNSNIASLDVSNPDVSIDAATAKQILAAAVEYDINLEMPQHMESQLSEGVEEGTGIILVGDGSTAKVVDSNAYSVGDIVYLPATESDPAIAIKIDSIEGSTIKYSTVDDLDTVFEEFEMYGTYDGVILSATDIYSTIDMVYGDKFNELAENESDEPYVLSCKVDKSLDHGDDYVIYTITDSDSGAKITLGINKFKVTPDIELKKGWFGIPYGVKRAECSVNFETQVNGHIETHVNKSIPLGTVEVGIPGTPVSVKVDLQLNLGADGKIDITYKCSNNANIKFDGNGLSQSFNVTNSTLDLEADLTLTAEVTLVATLKLIGLDIVNAEITTGVVGVVVVEASPLDDTIPDCVDLEVYVPLRWGVNQRSCFLTTLNGNWKCNGVVWGSDDSPFRWHWHFENGVEVGECTRGEQEAVETNLTDEESELFDEYKYFDFEPIEFDLIELSSYHYFIESGENVSINYTSLPDDVTEADLVYTSSNNDICTVSDSGVITGVGAGSTTIIIKSQDGKYEMSLTVTVSDDYSIEGFEAL